MTLYGITGRCLEELGSVFAQVARLKGGVSDRRPFGATLNHREEQIGIGIALRGMQHIVHTLHSGRYAHSADMRRAFIGPQGKLHRASTRRIAIR